MTAVERTAAVMLARGHREIYGNVCVVILCTFAFRPLDLMELVSGAPVSFLSGARFFLGEKNV